MRRIIVFIIGVAAALAVVIMFFNNLDAQLRRQKFEAERGALKQVFATRVPHLVAVDDEHSAFDLVQSVKNYAKDLLKVYGKFPEFKDPDAVLKRHEAEYKEGKKDESKIRAVRERIALVKDVWERLIKDDYKPVATAHDKSLRVDIYSVEKKAVDGQDKLLVHMLFVGGLPDKNLSFGTIEMNVILADDETTAKKRKAKELKDNAAVRKAQITGGGEPYVLILEPEKWVEDFPPGMTIGLYEFPLFPAESQELSMSMNFEVKNAGGGKVTNDIKFPNVKMGADWKLPQGSAYDAEEQTDGN